MLGRYHHPIARKAAQKGFEFLPRARRLYRRMSNALAGQTGDPSAGPRGLVAFPVVAIGAGEGSLEALADLLPGLPPESGMALVVVARQSALGERGLMRRLKACSPMPVILGRQGLALRPDHLYLCCGFWRSTIQSGVLQCDRAARETLPVDVFLHSLARDQGNSVVGVVLSGASTDGARGLSEVRAQAGLALVQDPATARAKGMPQACVVEGCDKVLSPRALGEELGYIAARKELLLDPKKRERAAEVSENSLEFRRLVETISEATGINFGLFERSLLKRLVIKRIFLTREPSFAAYLARLEKAPWEAREVYRDFLIDHTGFFRTPKAFEGMQKQVFPSLMPSVSPQRPLRIWITGCATGEEAYSTAMALLESAGRPLSPREVRIFATDIVEDGLERARRGIYSPNIRMDVSPARLERFFEPSGSASLRIKQEVRSLCTFGRHILGQDPPLADIDVLVCRNLLFYRADVLREVVLPDFDQALKPGGYLVVGEAGLDGLEPGGFQALDAPGGIFLKGKPGSPPDVRLALTQSRAASQAPAGPAEQESLEGFMEQQNVRNEELLAANRQLQSLSLELELARQELESNNKKLAEANAALQATNQELSRINQVIGPLVTVAENGDILICNPAFAALLGYQPAELTGQPLSHVLPSFQTMQLEAGAQGHEMQGRTKEGASIPLEVSFFKFPGSQGAFYIGHTKDLSLQRETEKERKQFVSRVSHELRTPLTSIVASLKLALSGATGQVGPELKEVLDIAERNSERLIFLINDILKLQRTQAGPDLRLTRHAVERLADAAVEEVRSIADQAGVRVVKGPLPGSVLADFERIVEVLVNLLSNAIRFSQRGGEVKVEARQETAFVEFRVEDQGIGIDPSQWEAIFQPFHQIESEKSRGGTGLGLSISKAIVEQHGGTIGLDSRPGKGSTFWFRLPRPS